MIDFHELMEEEKKFKEWREENPGPVIWVTSCHVEHLLHTFSLYEGNIPPLRPISYHYVGRDMKRSILFKGSALFNPFKVKPWGEYEPGESISLYKTHLWRLIKQENIHIMNELFEIYEESLQPRGIALACWCSPAPCHADVIKKAVLWLYNQRVSL